MINHLTKSSAKPSDQTLPTNIPLFPSFISTTPSTIPTLITPNIPHSLPPTPSPQPQGTVPAEGTDKEKLPPRKQEALPDRMTSFLMEPIKLYPLWHKYDVMFPCLSEDYEKTQLTGLW
jgi:hypothetical protein